METVIQDYFRIVLSAKHRSTSIIVNFPLIHIVVESYENDKGQESFLATCLEYSQAFESHEPQSAVVGLINLMHDYFLSTIKKEGKEFLLETLETTENEELWGRVRRYLAEKFRANLEFVEKSFNSKTTKAELKELGSKIVQPNVGLEVVSKNHHEKVTSQKDATIDQQHELIRNILKELDAKIKQIEEQNRTITELRNGLEGGQEEWTEQQPDIRIGALAQ
ncbi:hypothetical protein [Leptospira adleri]|uniref:Uncharacterized protein n=1 Tax=Leptospira adleri TaxID=2023186 RepID=A0A2M9YJA7_9LEPT|nr:hypothetical protein [Leptospira adleri]PJZ51622.1 hypothetical protein CH380_19445 [Leptospira adleri]PJZ61869.1 hypothetical protein CH376_10720 [Leptospira adleri]